MGHRTHLAAPGDSDSWMACTDRLRLRVLRADDAVPLRSVMEPEYRGRGLATEAAAAALDWAERNGVDVYSSVRPRTRIGARA